MSNRTINLSDNLYDYILTHSLREHPVQLALRQKTANMEWSQMQIAPEQGQFMALLVKLISARKTIEVGVFTGYSALSIALALPEDGKIIACDNSKEWTDIARSFWKQAAVDHKIKLKLAPAVDTLEGLIADQQANTYDFVFIDADKTNYDRYYELALQLVHPGGLIVIDNTLWGGSVADPKIQDDDTRAIRELNKKLLQDRRIDYSLIPVADGLSLIRKL